MSDTEILCRKIGYQFKDKSHLKAALTHRSVRDTNNERLEFLGDSIVNFIIAETLYRRCPRAKEGDLSRLRAFLVRGETLAEVAQAFELGEYLRLGMGELKSGGFRRKSILADALEALIAAIYLDSGLETCRERVLTWFEDYIQQATTKGTAQKDPKTRLQEHLQALKVALPRYSVAAVDGEAHDQTFHVQCRVDSLKKVTEGVGPSRRHAEQDAAEKLLELLEKKK